MEIEDLPSSLEAEIGALSPSQEPGDGTEVTVSTSFVFLQLNKLACSPWMGLHSSVSRALQAERRGHGFESRWNPETLFMGYFAIAEIAIQLRWSHIHFIRIPAVHIISFCVSFLSRVDGLNKLAGVQCMGLHSSAGRALQRERRGYGFESRWSPGKPFYRVLRNCLNCHYNCHGHIFISFLKTALKPA